MKKEVFFSDTLRKAALEEVREAYRKKMKLKQEHRELYFKLDEIKDEIGKLDTGIEATAKAFGFELRAVRDAKGKCQDDPEFDQEYLRDFFFEEDEE